MKKNLIFCLITILLSILLIGSCGKEDPEEIARQVKLLELCRSNLRNLGAAMNNYKISHGKYPDSINDLIDEDFVDEKQIICPVSGKKYILDFFSESKKRFKISCPNPEQHIGRGGIKSRTTELYYNTDTLIHKVK